MHGFYMGASVLTSSEEIMAHGLTVELSGATVEVERATPNQ